MTTLFLPAATQLTITADANSAGNLFLMAAGKAVSLEAAITVSTAPTFGPFNEPKYFDLVTDKGSLVITQAPLSVIEGVTSTAAELNILDGVTATSTELNLIDGYTGTTVELNLIDGYTGTTADLNIMDGVTSTTAELNILDGVTSTTAELNILDGVTSTAAELNILDGVTATSTELNLIDGYTGTTAELNILDNAPADVTIVYATGVGTDNIRVTLTVVDATATVITDAFSLDVWISDSANGEVLTSTAASGALTIITGEQREEVTAKKHIRICTDENGVALLDLVDSANTTGEYFCVKHPTTGATLLGAATVETDYEGGI